MNSAAQRNWHSHSGGSASSTSAAWGVMAAASSGSGWSDTLTSSTKSLTARRVGTLSRWTRMAFSPWGEKAVP